MGMIGLGNYLFWSRPPRVISTADVQSATGPNDSWPRLFASQLTLQDCSLLSCPAGLLASQLRARVLRFSQPAEMLSSLTNLQECSSSQNLQCPFALLSTAAGLFDRHQTFYGDRHYYGKQSQQETR